MAVVARRPGNFDRITFITKVSLVHHVQTQEALALWFFCGADLPVAKNRRDYAHSNGCRAPS